MYTDVQTSRFEMRHYARESLARIFSENLYGASEAPPKGTLRGIDVLAPSAVSQKLSRALQIAYGQRGWSIDLLKPKGFFEKLVISKFFAPIPMPSVADKLACQTYIPSSLQNEVETFPVIWRGNAPITQATLAQLDLAPGKYYAKSNCGSGTNQAFSIPPNETELRKLEEYSAGWLQQRHGERAGEWWYDLIRPQVFIEPDFAPEGESLVDWKFHTGNGRILAVQVDVDRASGHRQLMFDRNFNFIPEKLFFRTGTPGPQPEIFDRMVECAEQIGSAFEYARVDLYGVGKKIILGEVTLAPIGGQRPPISSKLDQLMGENWQGGIFGKA